MAGRIGTQRMRGGKDTFNPSHAASLPLASSPRVPPPEHRPPTRGCPSSLMPGQEMLGWNRAVRFALPLGGKVLAAGALGAQPCRHPLLTRCPQLRPDPPIPARPARSRSQALGRATPARAAKQAPCSPISLRVSAEVAAPRGGNQGAQLLLSTGAGPGGCAGQGCSAQALVPCVPGGGPLALRCTSALRMGILQKKEPCPPAAHAQGSRLGWERPWAVGRWGSRGGQDAGVGGALWGAATCGCRGSCPSSPQPGPRGRRSRDRPGRSPAGAQRPSPGTASPCCALRSRPRP